MKIAIFGASGNVGSRITDEAVRRGHEVTGLGRNGPTSSLPDAATWQQGDAADSSTVVDVAASHDVIVSALGPARGPGADRTAFVTTIQTLAEAVGSTRLAVVGGAGSLLGPDGARLVDAPDFPDAYKAEALVQGEALEYLRSARADLDWTYLSPAPQIADGPANGYELGTDLPVGAFISYADFASALLDELETPTHIRRRFTAASR